MSVEQAIIELVVSGTGQFDAANQKIQADLTSTERAGKSAESAAQTAERGIKSAEQAARQLTLQIAVTISKLNAAVGLAQRVASTLGEDRDSAAGQVLDAFQGGLGGAAQGASLGKLGGPVGAGVGASVGALFGIVQSLQETEKRLKTHSDKVSSSRGNEITEALLREAGLSKFDHAISPHGRQVQ